MDAMRYLILTGMMHARIMPDAEEEEDRAIANHDRSPVTGY